MTDREACSYLAQQGRRALKLHFVKYSVVYADSFF